MSQITRRLLLGVAGVGSFGLLAFGGSRLACRWVPRNHPDFFSLLDIVPDDAAARRIGAEAIATGGLPPDLPGLAGALTERPLIREALGTDCPTSRRTLVQDQCAMDFADGRTLVIDGWVLSETEASLCAARNLSSPQLG